MKGILDWLLANISSITEIVTTVITLATLIVALTPNTSDDKAVSTIAKIWDFIRNKVLVKFSLINQDKTLSK